MAREASACVSAQDRGPSPGAALRFNKVCEIEDFSHPDLSAVLRDVGEYKLPAFGDDFPRNAEHRKDWEIAMSVRALRHFGAIHPEAAILGVAAGMEDTAFYLTRHVKHVFATDLYLDAGSWSSSAPSAMLSDPGSVAPMDFDPERLVVQHMDGRWLTYPDGTFDGVFSSSSIEHFGALIDVAHSAFEIGRVLKPGGIATISTEFRLTGPPGGIGWPGALLLMDETLLRRYIIEASGLEPVDELQTTISDATMNTRRDLGLALSGYQRTDPQPLRRLDLPCTALHLLPFVVAVTDGYVFTSVHLALRKEANYPASGNEWARTTPEKRTAIATAGKAAASFAERGRTGAAPVRDVLERGLSAAEHGLDRVDQYRHEARTLLRRLDAAWKPPPSLDGGLVRRRVGVADGATIEFVVDPAGDDQGSRDLAAGHCPDPLVVEALLRMLRPGDGFVDVGAGLGVHALAAAAAGCRVVAIEADARRAARLRASASVNALFRLRVLAVPPGSAGPPVDTLLEALGWSGAAVVRMDMGVATLATVAGMTNLLSPANSPAILYRGGASTPGLVGALERFGYTSYLLEPRRLVKVTSTEDPPHAVVDCVAAKSIPAGLSDRWVQERMSRDERVARLVAESRHPDPMRRAYAARTLVRASDEVTAHAALAGALAALATDPVEQVRDMAVATR